MVDEFFRISVIDGALNLRRHQKEYPDIAVGDAVRQLQNGPTFLAGYDYQRAIELGLQVGWDSFDFDGTRQTQLQETLKRLAIRLKPFWARVSHLGRKRVMQVVSEDQRQCFDFAGLLVTPPSDTVVSWWDELGAYFRAEEEQRNLEIGREGERRTMTHETQRLKEEGIPKQPIWIALEDNRAGYDVHSFQRTGAGESDDLRIEVKTSSYSPTHFILTRPEWDIASKQPDLHLFHIWNLESEELLKLSVTDMAAHMPRDTGEGQWREVRVTLTN